MTRLQVLKLLKNLLDPCAYKVPDTGNESYPPDYVVNHETLMDIIAQEIQDEKEKEYD